MRARCCCHLTTLGTAENRTQVLEAKKCMDCGGEFLLIQIRGERGRLVPFTSGHALSALRMRAEGMVA